MADFRDEFVEVSPDYPCPVCHKPDWCCVKRDGQFVLCQRTPSGRRYGEAGWRHILAGDGAPPPSPVYAAPKLPPTYLSTVVEHSQHVAREEGMLTAASEMLGLTEEALSRFGLGWSRSKKAWTFPMYDEYHQVIGIRYRTPDGHKFSFKGGKNGLFRTNICWSSREPIVIVEGPTDAAAGLQVGLNTIGRPSCLTGNRILRAMNIPKDNLVILADADQPGLLGAKQLQREIGGRIIVPNRHNDLREIVQDWVSDTILQDLNLAAFGHKHTYLFDPL